MFIVIDLVPLKVAGVQYFRLQIWTEISHSLGFQTCDNQKCEGLTTSVFWSFKKQGFHQIAELEILTLESP